MMATITNRVPLYCSCQPMTVNYINKMSRRQSFRDSSRQTLPSLEQYKDLQLELELKTSEIQDLKFELATLRKKQSIWNHLGETYEKANAEQQRKQYQEQNERLKSQLVNLVNEVQQKNTAIQEQREKINDLKEYNQELKKLNERTEQVHKKEVEVIRSSLCSENEVDRLRRQRDKLEEALAKCDEISKEMEEYYMGEIDGLKRQIQEQKNVIVRLENSKNALEQELNRRENQSRQQAKVQEAQSRWKEINFSELIKKQSQEKKWEITLTQVKQKYEKQISELKDQIKFLIVKIENLQDSRNYCQNLSNSILTQSKMGMSSSSNDSFRFNPNNSFASSIKQSLSRRDAGPLRTPSKSSRQSNNLGYLLDRTNL